MKGARFASEVACGLCMLIPPSACRVCGHARVVGLPGHSAGGGTDGYLMRYPGEGLHVSALSTGSIMRFINHGDGCAENVNVFPFFLDGAFHMCVVTVAPVVRGTQLLLDYGPSYWARRTDAKSDQLKCPTEQ